MATLSILMPAYNEAATICSAIEEVLAAEFPVSSIELIVIDDGSNDATQTLLEGFRERESIRVLRHDRNRGKGAALRTGLAEATGAFTAVLDADREYQPADISRMLEPLLRGEAEAVFGTRGFESHSAYSFWYVIGNKVVTFAANLLYNSWVSDIMTCHKAMPTELFRSLQLREPGFGIEPEITARLLRQGVRIFEVPVTYRARTRSEGKKLTAADGVRVLWTLARCRLS